MNKIYFFLIGISLVLSVTSCSDDTSGNDNGVAWAGLVESKTILLKPEGWDDEYWESVNQNVDQEKMFNTILNAVLEERLKAYDILSDEELTVKDVIGMIANVQLLESGESQAQQITENDLSTIRMREEWFFDEEELKLSKKVTRLDFLLKKLNLDGEYIGDRALFYVYLNN